MEFENPPRPLCQMGNFSRYYSLANYFFISLLLTFYEEQETIIGGSPGGGGTA
jgi:hypothetical protein